MGSQVIKTQGFELLPSCSLKVLHPETTKKTKLLEPFDLKRMIVHLYPFSRAFIRVSERKA